MSDVGSKEADPLLGGNCKKQISAHTLEEVLGGGICPGDIARSQYTASFYPQEERSIAFALVELRQHHRLISRHLCRCDITEPPQPPIRSDVRQSDVLKHPLRLGCGAPRTAGCGSVDGNDLELALAR